VRRIPRLALLLFCLAYVLPGFVGREAWKSADMAALGFMSDLVNGASKWLSPTLVGVPAENPSLLPYWLGAWSMQAAPSWLAQDFAARIPFGLLLTLALVATWYGSYYLARSPRAQPVAFAFGGEALPADYARAVADGALLAFIACLGLAQLSHETTPALAQLGFSALLFYALAALHYRPMGALAAALIAMTGLSLSGAPTMAALFSLGGVAIHLADKGMHEPAESTPDRSIWHSVALIVGTLIAALLTWKLGLWRWKLDLPQTSWSDWSGFGQLLLWFTWPAGPMALWTIWRWRHQLLSRHISRHLALPVWFVTVGVLASFASGSSDRALLLALPPMASLAAFALPTLSRQVAALIDWFTLLFFSACGFTIWVVWIAMQTGFPPQPAANVARLAPGFSHNFSLFAFSMAVIATAAWAWLVKWRVGRHRAALWKSLVLPGCGAALCWLLLMTLWMPLLNYTQSYSALIREVQKDVGSPACVEVLGLDQGTTAALQFYGGLTLQSNKGIAQCPWLLAQPGQQNHASAGIDSAVWQHHAQVSHPADGNESIELFQRRR
jgi:4-amino-4-deoxy-L-arabinose transferase-like glycosyltransferase